MLVYNKVRLLLELLSQLLTEDGGKLRGWDIEALIHSHMVHGDRCGIDKLGPLRAAKMHIPRLLEASSSHESNHK